MIFVFAEERGECLLMSVITFVKFLGFVMGICFFQVKYDQGGIQNIYGALFFMLTTCTFSNMASVYFVSMTVLYYYCIGNVINVLLM